MAHKKALHRVICTTQKIIGPLYLLARKQLVLVQEAEQYRLDIVALTATHYHGFGTSFLDLFSTFSGVKTALPHIYVSLMFFFNIYVILYISFIFGGLGSSSLGVGNHFKNSGSGNIVPVQHP